MEFDLFKKGAEKSASGKQINDENSEAGFSFKYVALDSIFVFPKYSSRFLKKKKNLKAKKRKWGIFGSGNHKKRRKDCFTFSLLKHL